MLDWGYISTNSWSFRLRGNNWYWIAVKVAIWRFDVEADLLHRRFSQSWSDLHRSLLLCGENLNRSKISSSFRLYCLYCPLGSNHRLRLNDQINIICWLYYLSLIWSKTGICFSVLALDAFDGRERRRKVMIVR